MRIMKLEYDKDADAAYVYFVDPISPGASVKTVEVDENIVLDFDKKGKLLGMEILNARSVLSKRALGRALASVH